MLSIQITDRMIQSHAADQGAYHKGYMYYLNNKVHQFRYDAENRVAKATVLGQEKFEITLAFARTGELAYSCCSCSGAAVFGQVCKHTVAVLKRLQYELQRQKGDSEFNQDTVNHFFTIFSRNMTEDKMAELFLEVHYELLRENQRLFSTLELRVGRERLYVVKNLKDFLLCFDNNSQLVFGKNFTFNPAVHGFSPIDQTIIDLLREVMEQERVSRQLAAYQSPTGTAFKGKKLFLADIVLIRLFGILKEKSFTANILGTEYDEIKIIDEELPLEFELNQDKSSLTLELIGEEIFIPLTRRGEYIYHRGAIYHPGIGQRQYFLPFYQGCLSRQKKLYFSKNESQKLVAEVLPQLRRLGMVKMTPDVEETLYQAEFQAKIFFDQVGKGISARVEFFYGPEMVAPLHEFKTVRTAEGKILVRDMEKERRILNCFEQAGFEVTQGRYSLKDDEKIFDFIREIIPVLTEIAELYYSDTFRRLKVKRPGNFFGGVRLDERSNMLELSFQIESIDHRELAAILASVKEKQRYHRLRDGSFLSLETPELDQFAGMMEELDLSPQELEKCLETQSEILLPQYRAAHLDSLLQEYRLQWFERNPTFQQMVRGILAPEEVDIEAPEGVRGILRDYQKVGFKWMKTLATYGLGGILADDMGLGKTLQVITLLLSEQKREGLPSLVIAPTSLVYHWQDEARRFAPDLRVLLVSGAQTERQELIGMIREADLVVTSYPLLRRDLEWYRDFEFNFCFLDEAQHIKNPGTISAKSVKQIKARNCFALTGTPIENSLTELWSIFDFILPGYLSSHSRFVKKYESPIIKEQDQKALIELNRKIKPFILRRMKRDVLKELPEKIETGIMAEMTPEQRQVYMAYLMQARGEILNALETDGFERSQIKILAALTRLRQICCHPGLFLED